MIRKVNISLQCLNGSNDSPVKVTKWEFKGHLLGQSSHRIRILPQLTRHRLDISSAEVSDTGTYTCTANKYEASVYITVYRDYPNITYITPTSRVKVGSNITLKCDGQNQDVVMWSKEEVSIATGQSSLLHIVNVTHVDNGSYECELRSTIGRAIGTIDLVVLSAYLCANLCHSVSIVTFNNRFHR